jgi:hypothetical protein
MEMRSVIVIASLACGPYGFAQAVHSFQINSYEFHGQRIPRWNGAALTEIDGTTIHSFDRDGQELRPASVTNPGTGQTLLTDSAAAADGSIVAGGATRDGSDHVAGFLAYIPAESVELRDRPHG